MSLMVIGLNKRFVDLDTVLVSDSRWNRPTEDRRGYERGVPENSPTQAELQESPSVCPGRQAKL